MEHASVDISKNNNQGNEIECGQFLSQVATLSWTHTTIKDNVIISSIKNPSQNTFLSSRGQTTIYSTPFQLFSFVKEINNLPSWNNMVERVKIVQLLAEDTYLVHLILKSGFLLTERELLCIWSYSRFGDTYVVSLQNASSNLVEMKENILRATLGVTGIIIRPFNNDSAIVEYIMQMDPKGWVPNSAAKWVEFNQALQLLNLKSLCETDKSDKELYNLFVQESNDYIQKMKYNDNSYLAALIKPLPNHRRNGSTNKHLKKTKTKKCLDITNENELRIEECISVLQSEIKSIESIIRESQGLTQNLNKRIENTHKDLENQVDWNNTKQKLINFLEQIKEISQSNKTNEFILKQRELEWESKIKSAFAILTWVEEAYYTKYNFGNRKNISKTIWKGFMILFLFVVWPLMANWISNYFKRRIQRILQYLT